jgi:hypothetical protein
MEYGARWLEKIVRKSRLFHTQVSILLLCGTLLAAQTTGDVDRTCNKGFCDLLVVRDGQVRFVETGGLLPTDLALGPYISAAQSQVSKTELPVRDLRSANGWRVVISAFLDKPEQTAGLRVHFFAQNGKQVDVQEVQMKLEKGDVGTPFGGSDEVLTITAWAEHGYNSRTSIWLLPGTGKPVELLAERGVVDRFIAPTEGEAGVWINRDTYDGIHAETKGRVPEFWKWDGTQKTLKPVDKR